MALIPYDTTKLIIPSDYGVATCEECGDELDVTRRCCGIVYDVMDTPFPHTQRIPFYNEEI